MRIRNRFRMATPSSLRLITVVCFVVGFACPAIAADLTIVGLHRSLLVNVPGSATQLVLTKTKSMVPYLTTIKGLTHLPNLRTLDISFTEMGSATDFTFFRDLPKLEELRLGFVHLKNLDFLIYLPSLRKLIAYDFIEFADKALRIDLASTPQIERLDMGTAELSDIPDIQNPPLSFKYLNLVACRLAGYERLASLSGRSYRIVLSDAYFEQIGANNYPAAVKWSLVKGALGD